MKPSVLLAAAVLAAGPSLAHGQTWRTLDVSRQLHDTNELHVNVQYGAGRFELRAATDPVLYAMRLRYNEDKTTPLHEFDPEARTLRIGVDNASTGWSGRHSDNDDKAGMRLALAPNVPLDLSLDLGATEANADFGGLSVRSLRVQSGAADETMDFSTPNGARLGTMAIDVGAASFTLRHIANANASSLTLNGGVGAVYLDFGGTWTGDMDAYVKVALGKVALTIPREVGVRLALDRFLTSFDNDGLEKRDGYYYSDNWDTAKHHLRIHVETTLGTVSIDRSGGTP